MLLNHLNFKILLNRKLPNGKLPNGKLPNGNCQMGIAKWELPNGNIAKWDTFIKSNSIQQRYFINRNSFLNKIARRKS